MFVSSASATPLLMGVFALVMVGTYVLIATEKIHKTLAAAAGALIVLVLGVWTGVFPYGDLYQFVAKDLNVLGVIIGTSVLVEVVGNSGLFHFIAIRIVKATGGDPRRLFTALVLLTFLFVTFLTIVPAMLVLSSLVIVVTRTLALDARPYMMGIALAANAGACTTLASGLPNLMIGTAAGLGYVDFLVATLPFSFLALGLVWVVVRLMYGKALPEAANSAEVEARKQQVQDFDEWALVKDPRVFKRAAIILGLTVVGFMVARPLGLGLDFIAVAGGTAALFLSGLDVEKTFRQVNWAVVLFFVALFTLIGAVEETGLLEVIAGSLETVIGSSVQLGLGLFCFATGVLSGIVDNIPVAATMVPVVRGLESVDSGPLWWAVALGANLGGSLTPIGSIAGVIAIHTLKKEANQRVGWGEFLKVGGTLFLVQVIAAIAYLIVMESLGFLPEGSQ
ncbi:MAG: ArsB/NhaD family transporter [Planctomycetota bacterium]